MLGPLIGSAMTSRVGFAWAGTLMSVLITVHVAIIMSIDAWSPRPRLKEGGYTELVPVRENGVAANTTPSAED